MNELTKNNKVLLEYLVHKYSKNAINDFLQELKLKQNKNISKHHGKN